MKRGGSGSGEEPAETHRSPPPGAPRGEAGPEDLPIRDRIKRGILGFVENEIKRSDGAGPGAGVGPGPGPGSGPRAALVFRAHSPGPGGTGAVRERRSPSHRRRRRHPARREREAHAEFEAPASNLSALERVDEYLRQYGAGPEPAPSGQLEIDANDRENNNSGAKDARYKQRKTRRKGRLEERHDKNANGRDISPKVFQSAGKSKNNNKMTRPTDLSAMLENIASDMTSYHEQYIDNPFSSPSPLTSPNDGRMGAFGSGRPDKIYLQGGGTFRAVSRDAVLGEGQRRSEEQKYLRLGDLTPLDIALSVQRAWRNLAPACHGLLGGLSLMHLLLLSCSDGMDAGHLSFHAVVTMPYVTTYFFLCVLCLLSVLDRLDTTSLDLSRGLQPYFQPIVLVILYMSCLLVCTAARVYDEMMVYQYTKQVDNATLFNVTMPTIPTFYHTWSHLSIWRAVLSILGLAYLVITNPQDLVYVNLTKLLQFKQSLQSIG